MHSPPQALHRVSIADIHTGLSSGRRSLQVLAMPYVRLHMKRYREYVAREVDYRKQVGDDCSSWIGAGLHACVRRNAWRLRHRLSLP